MSAGSGLGRGETDAAAIDAALEAMASCGGAHADLALVFLAGDASARAHQILHAVRRITGARAVIGCSGAGVLTEKSEVEGDPAVAVLAIDDDRLVATPFLIEDQASRHALGLDVAQRVEATVAEGGCLIVLPDARGLDPRVLLGGLQEAVGFVPVVGAVAAGEPLFEMFNTDAVVGGLAGLAVAGRQPLIAVAQGCTPIGDPYVITRAEEHVIHEIGSRPAVTVLREAIMTVPDAQERIPRAGLFAGLAMDPSKSPLERGDFLIRNLAGMDPASGAIAVGERVQVGQTIQFQLRDAQASREDLRSALADLARRLDGRRPAFGCYFDCAGRGQGLFGLPDHDVTMIRAELGEFPLVGFFGNGEFAPVGRRNFFHTYTGALVVFPSAD